MNESLSCTMIHSSWIKNLIQIFNSFFPHNVGFVQNKTNCDTHIRTTHTHILSLTAPRTAQPFETFRTTHNRKRDAQTATHFRFSPRIQRDFPMVVLTDVHQLADCSAQKDVQDVRRAFHLRSWWWGLVIWSSMCTVSVAHGATCP